MENPAWFRNCPYWKDRDLYLLNKVKTFEEIADVNDSVLERMPNNLIQVCGPISDLDKKTKELKEKIFRRSIAEYRRNGMIPFDHSYTWKTIDRLAQKWTEKNMGYCMPILEVVYTRIFNSGKISEVSFLPNLPIWQPSIDIEWERKNIPNFNIDILEFPPKWYLQILKELKLTYLVFEEAVV